MARPHIEFLQSQVLPWFTLPGTAARPGADCKILSRDAEAGAVSVILRYPAGFAIDRPHRLDSDEEFFVLKGEVSIGDTVYGEGAYAFLPKDFPRGPMRVSKGADVLTFFPHKHDNHFDGGAGYDKRKLVEKVDTKTATWDVAGVDPKVVGSGLAKLVLRLDPDSGERTWILRMGASSPDLKAAPLETHPFVEEMLLLDGAISMPWGVLRQGAYFWRPGGIQHGPIASKPGCTAFFRCKEGPFSTNWTSHTKTIQWDAPYQPVLPPDLQKYKDAPVPAGQAY